MKSKAVQFDALVNSLFQHHYGDSDVGDGIFRISVSMISQAGMNDMATVTPMIPSAIFVNVGISIHASKIVDSLPGRDEISNLVIQNEVDTVIHANQKKHHTKPHCLLLLR